MNNNEDAGDKPLPLGQLVKMTAPVLFFGVILPFVDMVTDLRMIIRLYVGVGEPVCSKNWIANTYYRDYQDYQGNIGACSTEQHPIFASMLLGKYNLS